LVYQMPITANSTQTLTIGITLGAYDTIYVATGTASSLTFHAFGSQIA
jgi:preprotein translocase subunit SecF